MADDDRLRFLFAKAFERSLPSADCPPAGQILAVVLGEEDHTVRMATVDHVARCSFCAEAWRVAALAEDKLGIEE